MAKSTETEGKATGPAGAGSQLIPLPIGDDHSGAKGRPRAGHYGDPLEFESWAREQLKWLCHFGPQHLASGRR